MISTVAMCLLLAVHRGISAISVRSEEISCQPVIINWAEFTQPSADMCGNTCNETGKPCVQMSNQHDNSNISASCRPRHLTSQEVFLLYKYCRSPNLPCRLEAVPGLLGPVTVKYWCLEDNIPIVDPCEEGNYTLTSVNFLYGYRRVVNATNEVTCSCSLTKLGDSNDFNIRAVNAYSPHPVDTMAPKIAVQFDNKKERATNSFPQDFIIQPVMTNVSLTLTVSKDYRIGRMWVRVSQQDQGVFSVKCMGANGTIPISSATQSPEDNSLLVPILIGVFCFLFVLLIGTVVFLRRRCCLTTTLCSRGGGTRELLEMGYLPANFTVNREAVERGVPDAFLRHSDTFSQRTSHGSLSGVDVMETVAAYLRSVYPQRSSTADPQAPVVSYRKSTSCPNVLHLPPCGLRLGGEGHIGGARSQPLEGRSNLRDTPDHLEITKTPTRSGDSSTVGVCSFYGDSWSNADDTYKDPPGRPGTPHVRDTRRTLPFSGLTNPRIVLDCAPEIGLKSTSAMFQEDNNGVSSDVLHCYNTRLQVEPATSEDMTLTFIAKDEYCSSDHKASETNIYDTASSEKNGFVVAPCAEHNEESTAANGTVMSYCRLTHEARAEDVKRPDEQCFGYERPQHKPQIHPLHYESVVLDSGPSAAEKPGPATGYMTSYYQTDRDGRLTLLKESDAQQTKKKRQKFLLVADSRPFYDHITHSNDDTYSSLNRQVRRQEVIDNVYSKSTPHLTYPAPGPSPILTYTAPDPPPQLIHS